MQYLAFNDYRVTYLDCGTDFRTSPLNRDIQGDGTHPNARGGPSTHYSSGFLCSAPRIEAPTDTIHNDSCFHICAASSRKVLQHQENKSSSNTNSNSNNYVKNHSSHNKGATH